MPKKNQNVKEIEISEVPEKDEKDRINFDLLDLQVKKQVDKAKDINLAKAISKAKNNETIPLDKEFSKDFQEKISFNDIWNQIKDFLEYPINITINKRLIKLEIEPISLDEVKIIIKLIYDAIPEKWLLSSVSEVAEASNKLGILGKVLGIVFTIGNIILPRIKQYYDHKKKEK